MSCKEFIDLFNYQYVQVGTDDACVYKCYTFWTCSAFQLVRAMSDDERVLCEVVDKDRMIVFPKYIVPVSYTRTHDGLLSISGSMSMSGKLQMQFDKLTKEIKDSNIT